MKKDYKLEDFDPFNLSKKDSFGKNIVYGTDIFVPYKITDLTITFDKTMGFGIASQKGTDFSKDMGQK